MKTKQSINKGGNTIASALTAGIICFSASLPLSAATFDVTTFTD